MHPALVGTLGGGEYFLSRDAGPWSTRAYVVFLNDPTTRRPLLAEHFLVLEFFILNCELPKSPAISHLTRRGNRPDADPLFGNDDEVTGHAGFDERPESLQPLSLTLSVFHSESHQENSGRGVAPQVHQLTEILVIRDQNAVLGTSSLSDLRVRYPAALLGHLHDRVAGGSKPLYDRTLDVFICDEVQRPYALSITNSSVDKASAAYAIAAWISTRVKWG